MDINQKDKLEILKLELESQKLQKEIDRIEEEKLKVRAEKNELTRSWYFKPAWWSILSTFFLGFGGFYVALQTNIIGIQDLKVKNKDLSDSIELNQAKLKSVNSLLDTKSKELFSANQKYKNISKKFSEKQIENKNLVGIKKKLEIEIGEIRKTNTEELNILNKQFINQQIRVLEEQNKRLMISTSNQSNPSIEANNKRIDSLIKERRKLD